MSTFKEIFDKNLNIVEVTILKEAYIALSLANGKVIMVPLSKFKKLKEASSDSLHNWRLISSGLGVRWEELDEDISLKGLLKDLSKHNPDKSRSISSAQKVIEVE